MSTPADPIVSSPKTIPYVWIVPIIALLVGGYLIFKEFSKDGPQITIVFDQGSGLEAGKTVLQHKGLAVGIVDSVRLTDDLSNVEANVTLLKSAKGLARENSKFWILRPEIGIEGIRGLDTLFSGPTIQVQPGIGPFKKRFEGQSRAPLRGSELGYHYVLRVGNLGSLKPGSPVLYRQFKVGEVIDAKLSPDATAVLVRIHIGEPYDRLVRKNTVFWNASGIDMKVGLLGAKIQTNSLESMLAGGVMFATPEEQTNSELAPENTEFELHNTHHEDWLKWSPSISLE